ncbi:hypothetical protein NDU88_010128 [Pleurodeles waltl]|uniref:Uncharacterized protein n=1 Tax=Pleurodeles waltl TaxID=8319 RepID=A0AAV7Q1A8_PLEWA|nr:hypothetical protein NDU88_010128 [Pleurodeles waltl]
MEGSPACNRPSHACPVSERLRPPHCSQEGHDVSSALSGGYSLGAGGIQAVGRALSVAMRRQGRRDCNLRLTRRHRGHARCLRGFKYAFSEARRRGKALVPLHGQGSRSTWRGTGASNILRPMNLWALVAALRRDLSTANAYPSARVTSASVTQHVCPTSLVFTLRRALGEVTYDIMVVCA